MSSYKIELRPHHADSVGANGFGESALEATQMLLSNLFGMIGPADEWAVIDLCSVISEAWSKIASGQYESEATRDEPGDEDSNFTISITETL